MRDLRDVLAACFEMADASADDDRGAFLLSQDITAALEQVDALRAALAPLLDDPIRYDSDARQQAECLFCDAYDSTKNRHAPRCPVLRKDELLGCLTDSTV